MSPAAVYHEMARLLVRAHGNYAAEFVRKRTVSARLMGDAEAVGDWARIASEVTSVLATTAGRAHETETAANGLTRNRVGSG